MAKAIKASVRFCCSASLDILFGSRRELLYRSKEENKTKNWILVVKALFKILSY